jgi:pyruvate dehydrogenase (quinone)
MMMGCDTLLMVGSGFPYSEFLPKEGQARGIQIDVDPRMVSLRYPMEVNLIGDSAKTLRALLPLLAAKPDRTWRQGIEDGVARWWKVLETRAMTEAKPLNPQRVFWELSPRLPERCILTCDSGSAANWYARDVRIRRGMMGSLSGGLATMGPAVPYGIAAKFAHPDRPVIAMVGDGAMQMNGINGLITLARHWREWRDPRFVVLVLNNGDLNQVSWEMRAQAGTPKWEDSQSLPDFSYARYAEMLGFQSVLMDRPDMVAQGWDEALAANRPVLVEARTDPNVPPLPPEITLKNAAAMMKTLWSGDPEAVDMLKQTAKDLMGTILPRGGASEGKDDGKR